MGETDENYDEDYFCFERDLKYLDVLATTKEDVFELMYFYGTTFWDEQVGTEEEYRNYLQQCIDHNLHEIDF